MSSSSAAGGAGARRPALSRTSVSSTASGGAGGPERKARSGPQVLLRRLVRLWHYVLFYLADGLHGTLALVTRYVAFLRGFLRRRLGKPLRRLRTHALSESRRLPPAAHPDISSCNVYLDNKEGMRLASTLYMPLEGDAEHPLGAPDLSGRAQSSSGESRFPTVLIRTPYGRHNLGPLWAQIFAERGYAVLLQDTRGRFESAQAGGAGGAGDDDFFPIKHEIADGGDCIEWIRAQPWSNGKVALFGVSYLGLTTYASAGSAAGRHVDAMVPVMTCAKTHPLMFHNEHGSLSLDLAMRWLWLVMKLLDTVHLYKFWLPGFQGELNEALLSVPLSKQDRRLMGREIAFVQEAMRCTKPTDPFWQEKNVLCDLSGELSGRAPCPGHIVAGWYDFFCKQSFADFADASRSDNGRHFRLTVGRWKHWDFMSYGAPSIKLAIDFFDRHVKGLGGPEWDELEEEGSPDAFPIQVGFLGTSPCRWIGLESWPPPRAALCAFPLTAAALPQQQQRQQQRQPLGEGAGCSHQRYDPTNPTPSLGGPSFDPHNGGCVEQGALEKREDVLAFTFTPDALGAQGSATYLCGDVYVDLHCASANPHTDFFFKLCDVDRDGQSWNVVEGIDRMTPEQWDSRDQEGWYHVRRRTKVGAVANVFKPGHAVRLQVSGGAHPLYLRNYGTGEPIADAVEFRVQDRKVFHDTQLLLPLMAKSDVEAATIAHPAYPDHVLEHEH